MISIWEPPPGRDSSNCQALHLNDHPPLICRRQQQRFLDLHKSQCRRLVKPILTQLDCDVVFLHIELYLPLVL